MRRTLTLPFQNSRFERVGCTSNGQNAWDILHNRKMKSNKWPHIQGAKNLGRRKGWKSANKIAVEEQRNKRGGSVRAKNEEQRCFINLRFFMHGEEQTWHLSHKSNLEHSYHTTKMT